MIDCVFSLGLSIFLTMSFITSLFECIFIRKEVTLILMLFAVSASFMWALFYFFSHKC